MMCATKCFIVPDCGWSEDAKTNEVRWTNIREILAQIGDYVFG